MYKNLFAATLILSLASVTTFAEDRYLAAALSDLEILKGQLPSEEAMSEGWTSVRWLGATHLSNPYAVGEQGEEIYLNFWPPYAEPPTPRASLRLVIRTDKPDAPTGRLYLLDAEGTKMSPIHFRVNEMRREAEDARTMFYAARAQHYERLMSLGIPGAAWFRHEAHEAWMSLGHDYYPPPTRIAATPWRQGTLDETFSLFTGGRALSENLQLDQELRVLERPASNLKPFEDIEGITVAQIDWAPLIAGLEPEKDPLAALIPANQHALFFPSFQAMLDLMDEAKANGTPILRLLEPRGEDALTQERYERQLCLTADDFTRLLGPKLILSVACTGSDPYLRTGSDVAFLFETDTPDAVVGAITARQETALAATPGAETVRGDVLGVSYKGVVTQGRLLSSYVAVVRRTVVVTNSLAQLEQIVDVAQEAIPNMASLGEYVYFRNRYKRGDDGETAFLVITDSAIRRWCSPTWRIAGSRRTRAAALLAEKQAEYLNELTAGLNGPRELEPIKSLLDLGDLTLTADGVCSSVYGTLGFQIPILELKRGWFAEPHLTKNWVTVDEQRAYSWFRDSYQRAWRANFDPIAIRFSIQPDTIRADLTVRPLIVGTEYRQYIDLTGNRAIKAGDGDPNDDALGQIVLSFNRDSEVANRPEMVNFIGTVVAQTLLGFDTLSLDWLGDWATVYVDKDPIWISVAELATGDKWELIRYLAKISFALPIGVQLDVGDSSALAEFLADVRAFAEKEESSLLSWEARQHAGYSYVKMGATEQGLRLFGMLIGEEFSDFALYYAPAADALVASLNEGVIQRALERRAAAKEAAPDAPKPAPWLGECMAMHVGDGAMTVLQALIDTPYHQMLQERAWGGIPILNEWKRRYGVEDPIAFHEQHWGARILCPGGGEYVWNDTFQTMESNVYGCPAAPRMPDGLPEIWERLTGGDFGVTFEDEGLRARAALTRKR